MAIASAEQRVAASNSRRNVVKTAILGALVVALACLALFGKSRMSRQSANGSDERPGPRLAFGRDATQQLCAKLDGSAQERELRTAAWLTFATLSSDGRAKLLDLIEELLDSLEAQRHPFGHDLAEETPEALVRREAPWLLPVWTASRSIAQTCFVGGDGVLTVVVADAKRPLPPHFRSFDAFDRTEGDSDLRLSRFLAWPITTDRRVSTTDRNAAMTLWAQLRSRTCARESSIALVVDQATQRADIAALVGSETTSRVTAIQARLGRCRQVECRGCEMLSAAMLAWSKGPPPAPVLPWLDLRAGEALVVPRLGALSQPERFAAELNRAVHESRHGESLIPSTPSSSLW
jgi:hypothetical protein